MGEAWPRAGMTGQGHRQYRSRTSVLGVFVVHDHRVT